MTSILTRVGQVLPHLRISTVGGTSFALNELGGRPAVIFLWASWHPSREALPRAAAAQLATIALDAQGPAFAMKYLKGVPGRLLIDSCALVSRVWGIKKLPVTLVVDSEGRLVASAELPTPSHFETAAALPNSSKSWARATSLEASSPKVEILVQGCGTFLSRKRVDDAADSLRAALALDPDNEIIRGQIAALTAPASR